MSTMEKREKETHLFTTRLNHEKPHFKGFNKNCEGIAEADSIDE